MVASAGMNTVYAQAASVRSVTGVDPAIIATIASTESNLNLHPFTLGITSAAVRGGSGTSGQVLGSGSPFAGTSQPAGFFAYNDGAEAAIAFRHYIEAYQPALVPLLNDAKTFFNPTGPLLGSNYYVPTPPEAAKAGGRTQAMINYYTNWLNTALSFGGATPASSNLVTNPDTGQITIPSINLNSTTGTQSNATTTTSGGPPNQDIRLFSTPIGNVSIPSGLILVLWGAVLLIVGALLAFGDYLKPKVTIQEKAAT